MKVFILNESNDRPIQMEPLDPLEQLTELQNATSKHSERILALNLLYAADALDYEEPISDLIANFNTGFSMEIRQESPVVLVVQTLIDKRDELDAQVKPYLEHWDYKRVSLMVRLILRYALWEILEKKTDPRIIINEAIELAKQFSEADAYRLVNGVLDAMIKNNER